MKRFSTFAILTLVIGFSFHAFAQRRERSGIRIEFASIGARGALQGSAFLPLFARDVAQDAVDEENCQVRRTVATARLARGPVKSVVLTLRATSGADARSLPLGTTACERAELRVELEDGRILVPTEGSLEIETEKRGHYSATARHEGEPLTLRGNFLLPTSL